ncbi:hypothetical protein CYMTET_46321, partial [Cymbomonas tetramitiformis]
SPELGQDWLRYLKAEHAPLSTFAVATLLALARIQRLEQPILEFLKGAVLKSFRDEKRLTESSWAAALPEVHTALNIQTDEPCGQRLDDVGAHACRLDSIMQEMAQDGSSGWDHVLPAMVQLGMLLMSCTTATGPARGRQGGDAVLPPSARSADLGLTLLRSAFVVHPTSRDAVMEAIQTNVGASSGELGAQYVCLLVTLVREDPHAMLEYVVRIKETLEYFAFLAPSTAVGLLLAVKPLFPLRPDLRDFIVLLLRKAMFSCEVAPRLIAVKGFLHLIYHDLRHPELRGSNQHEASCSQQPSSSQVSEFTLNVSTGAGGLLQEMLAFLRRALTQQALVRATLYEGLYGIVLADPLAGDAVFQLLLPHVRRFYEADEGLAAPLKLEACALMNNDTTTVRLVEPLQHLLQCVNRLLLLQPAVLDGSAFSAGTGSLHGSGGSRGAAGVLKEHLASLQRRILKCELEDFELDQSSDFSPTTPQGALNLEYANILLGTLEVLIEGQVDVLVSSSEDEETEVQDTQAEGAVVDAVHKLFEMRQRLYEIVKEKAGKGAGKGTGAGNGGGIGRGRPKRAKTGDADQGTQAPAAGVATTGAAGSMRRVEQRVPMLTPRCLALLLEAVVGEGVRPSRTAARATAPAALQALAPLTREPPFQAFVLQAAWQLLRAGTGSTGAPRTAWGLLGNGGQASSEGGSNIGDAQGNIAEAALVEESRQWLHLGLPLLRACEALILSATGAGQAGGVAGGKVVRKDGGDGLALVAVRCLDLLTQAASQEQLAGMLQEVLPRATPPGRQAAVAEPVAEPVAEAAFGNSSAGCQAGRDLGKGEAGEGEEKCNEEEDEQDEEAEDPMLTMQVRVDGRNAALVPKHAKGGLFAVVSAKGGHVGGYTYANMHHNTGKKQL